MKIKIYKHKNIKAKIDDDIAKIIPYFKSDFVKQFLDIDIELEVETTEVKKQDVVVKLFLPNDKKYDSVMYLYNRGDFFDTSFGLTINFSKNTRGIFLATSKADDQQDYTWKSMVHEIVHSIFYKVMSDRNIVLEDPLDKMLVNGVWQYYYKNEQMYAPDGNFAEAFKRLSPYFNNKVIITRKTYTQNETLGELSYNGYICKTLERAWKNNLPSISCIPKGTYQVKYTFSPKFMKYTYEIQNVPQRSSIRIHSGNYWFEINGCVLLGTGYSNLNNDGEIDIINSRTTVNKFETLLNKRDFTLTIV